MDSFEKKHERGINNMGELLLKGYIMTAEACPDCNCPYFKKTSNSIPFCPLCDKKENNENENTKRDQTIITAEKNNQQIISNNDEMQNDISKKENSINLKMSELLLAGWTLTNDNCPFCVGVPLMKNKEKQQFCVKCEKHFISEEEAKKQNMAIKNGKIENVKQEEKVKHLNTVQNQQGNNRIIKHSFDKDDTVVQSIDKEIISPIKKEKITLNSISEETILECSKTSTALIHQLSSLRNKLEVINENNDSIPNIHYTVEICDAISSVVKALNACNSIINN